MAKALRPGTPQGLGRRQSLYRSFQLSNAAGESQLSEASYRQFLNHTTSAAERLGDAESQIRNGV